MAKKLKQNYKTSSELTSLPISFSPNLNQKHKNIFKNKVHRLLIYDSFYNAFFSTDRCLNILICRKKYKTRNNFFLRFL